MADLIEIVNDGPRLVSTNYWETDLAQAGYCYLSINAGTFRLLVPRSRADWLPEMSTAEHVVITRGPWPDAGNRMCWEVMFEDRTDSPFAIQMVPEQCDRAVPPADMGRRVGFAVWTEGGLAMERPGLLRSASRLPYLKPWAGDGRA